MQRLKNKASRVFRKKDDDNVPDKKIERPHKEHPVYQPAIDRSDITPWEAHNAPAPPVPVEDPKKLAKKSSTLSLRSKKPTPDTPITTPTSAPPVPAIPAKYSLFPTIRTPFNVLSHPPFTHKRPSTGRMPGTTTITRPTPPSKKLPLKAPIAPPSTPLTTATSDTLQSGKSTPEWLSRPAPAPAPAPAPSPPTTKPVERPATRLSASNSSEETLVPGHQKETRGPSASARVPPHNDRYIVDNPRARLLDGRRGMVIRDVVEDRWEFVEDI